METIKGLARRTSQSLKEKVSGVDADPEDPLIEEVSRKVTDMSSRSRSISEKLSRSIRLLEDLGKTLKEIGEEHRQSPDLAAESRQLAEGVYEIGIKLVALSSEHRVGMQIDCIDLLTHFSKECAKLNNLEDVRRRNRLEYNFFKAKVNRLREKPPKDFSRIPRNEQILENWRIGVWRATENYKIFCSQLYLKGRQSLDRSVISMVQVLKSFFDTAFGEFRHLCNTSRLPEYSTNSVLRPTPLPPNPLPGPFAGSILASSRLDSAHTLPREDQAPAAPHDSTLHLEERVEGLPNHTANPRVLSMNHNDAAPNGSTASVDSYEQFLHSRQPEEPP
ncbi:unnamed protein product [Phytomonas sp. Hart1]|nr:unnamed protein product [Phytomonas sp. Hart1]|eukprot:CCW68177.1 unnamed protein product [Phytomonas sp. isolate Hart1]